MQFYVSWFNKSLALSSSFLFTFHILSRNFFGSPSSVPISTHGLFLSDLRGVDNSPSVYLCHCSYAGRSSHALQEGPGGQTQAGLSSTFPTGLLRHTHPCLLRFSFLPIFSSPTHCTSSPFSSGEGHVMVTVLGSRIRLSSFLPLTAY